MRQYAVVGLVLAASGCVSAGPDAVIDVGDGESGAAHIDESAAVAAQPLIGTPCPDWGCGVNSPQIDNSFFHELNLDGLPNLEGYSLHTAAKGSALYTLSVEDARLIARFYFGAIDAPRTLTGTALQGLQIALQKVNPQTGATFNYTMSVEQVRRSVEYRAHPPDGSTPPVIETYKFFIQGDGPFGAWLCQNGAPAADPGEPMPMTLHSAVVFEGERINATRKYISPTLNTRWFNIGCAESAVAKLHLYGHTKASSVAGFHTTIAERQTMLKMLVADYCGTGKPFTVAGQPLFWEDDQETMVVPFWIAKTLEARWTPNGAACLNTPRVIASSSEDAAIAFPTGVERAIAAACPRPPRCPQIDVSYHLQSYNPT
jgi:hypothetical protein